MGSISYLPLSVAFSLSMNSLSRFWKLMCTRRRPVRRYVIDLRSSSLASPRPCYGPYRFPWPVPVADVVALPMKHSKQQHYRRMRW